MLGGRKGTLRILATGFCVSAAVALCAAAPASAAASAAPTAGSAVNPKPVAHLTGPALAAWRAHDYRLLGTPVRAVITRSSHPSPAPAGARANFSCQTVNTAINQTNIWGGVLWTYTQSTYYCWDGVTVTYHDTWQTPSIAGWATALGWQFKGTSNVHFGCFYATSRWCSGNTESAQGEFDFCPIRVGCVQFIYPTIKQDEYYNGAWYGSGTE